MARTATFNTPAAKASISTRSSERLRPAFSVSFQHACSKGVYFNKAQPDGWPQHGPFNTPAAKASISTEVRAHIASTGTIFQHACSKGVYFNDLPQGRGRMIGLFQHACSKGVYFNPPSLRR